NKKLDYLVSIADKEDWSQTDIHTGEQNSTIFYYIVHTFDRCLDQGKIYISEDKEYAYFNTGLMNAKGNEIFGGFEKNKYISDNDPSHNYWYFKEFILDSDKSFMQKCQQKPGIATYFEKYEELYFNPDLDILINFDHIYNANFERLPSELKALDEETANFVFAGFLKLTMKKIKRNNRIPVPQFYNNKIMFLIPVKIFDSKTIVIAVEKINNAYRGNTILSAGMAYNCARLLSKPESDWLLNTVDNKSY
ncbi:MAG: DUF3825 domain-containing protein, partial [Bacilli bacterium]